MYGMNVTFPTWKSFMYVEVFQITERRKGMVQAEGSQASPSDACAYKTRSVGFSHRERPKGAEEIYAPLDTKLTSGKEEVTLELMWDKGG